MKDLQHILVVALSLVVFCPCSCSSRQEQGDGAADLKVKDYRPVSVFKLPEHHPEQAKFAVIDMHSHPYEETVEGVKAWAERARKHNIKHSCD